jgi:arabinan endo-1,5-alpha-L-arabinosidase
VTGDGHGLHLVWKSDGNCCGLHAQLWEQDLTADGLSLTGRSHLLLTADLPWQAGIVENPALLRASRGWWLFYSGNRFDVAGYATGLAWCPTLRGPCRETSESPFLAGTATQFAPGGLDFFRDAHGTEWAAFATWSRPPRNGRFYCCRPLNIAPVLSS